MITDRIQAMRELCGDLDASIQMARENRMPIRAVMLIELARDDLQRSIDQVADGSNVVDMKANVQR